MLLHMLFSNSQETPAFSITIPCKVQSHIAAGKPILTMLSSEGPRIIEEAKCGYVASSGNYRMLAQNILIMSKLDEEKLITLGNRAELYAQKEFDRNKLITLLENWFAELHERPKGGP